MYICVHQWSDIGTVGPWWGREHVRGVVVTQRSRALRVGGQRERDWRVLIVGVEPQPLSTVAHVVCESGAVGVRGTGGAVVVVRTHVQLIQGDGADGRAVHGEGVAGIAGKMWKRVCSHGGAHVSLWIILLTAVILKARHQQRDRNIVRGLSMCQYRGNSHSFTKWKTTPFFLVVLRFSKVLAGCSLLLLRTAHCSSDLFYSM